jgi:hypothetical protein
LKKKEKRKRKQSHALFSAKHHINRKILLTGPSASPEPEGVKSAQRKRGKRKEKMNRTKPHRLDPKTMERIPWSTLALNSFNFAIISNQENCN